MNSRKNAIVLTVLAGILAILFAIFVFYLMSGFASDSKPKELFVTGNDVVGGFEDIDDVVRIRILSGFDDDEDDDNDANSLPVANAGANQIIPEGSLVTLNGSLSSDADGDLLTYSWTQISGIIVTLSNSNSANPTFTAPQVASQELLKFQLIVNDGKINSASDTVDIIVSDTSVLNQPPVASNLSISLGEDTWAPINLQCSDPENNVMVYSVALQPSNGVLSGTGSALIYTPNANFNGADSFTYRCNDGNSNSNTATVSITVTPDNSVVWGLLQNKAVNEDSLAGTIVYQNIFSQVTDFDSPIVLTILPNQNFALGLSGSNLVINSLAPNWYGSETVTVSVGGVPASFILTINQILDECSTVYSIGGSYTYCD